MPKCERDRLIVEFDIQKPKGFENGSAYLLALKHEIENVVGAAMERWEKTGYVARNGFRVKIEQFASSTEALTDMGVDIVQSVRPDLDEDQALAVYNNMIDSDPELDGGSMTDELILAVAQELYPDHRTIPCEVRVHHKDKRTTSLRGTLDLVTGVVVESEKPVFWHESPVTHHTVNIPGIQGQFEYDAIFDFKTDKYRLGPIPMQVFTTHDAPTLREHWQAINRPKVSGPGM